MKKIPCTAAVNKIERAGKINISFSAKCQFPVSGLRKKDPVLDKKNR
jgi:hypothetical protein